MKSWPKAIAVIAGLAVAGYSIRHFENCERRKPPGVRHIASQEWLEQPLGQVVFETPWRLEPHNLELPPEMTSQVRSLTAIGNANDSAGTAIFATKYSYREDVSLDLDEAADAAIANLRNAPGTLAVEGSKIESTVLGARAFEIQARIQREQKGPLQMRGLVFGHGNDQFVFLLFAEGDQAKSRTVWERLRKSIRTRP